MVYFFPMNGAVELNSGDISLVYIGNAPKTNTSITCNTSSVIVEVKPRDPSKQSIWDPYGHLYGLPTWEVQPGSTWVPSGLPHESIWGSPDRTHVEPGCTTHLGPMLAAHMGPI
ncbi:hypothetical protein DPMN_093039 [Dreissena polymorpha]|uniref:Uncharacterized protein n=1 Tax=Dreissena polymorpha TaxID=45954 RepID=A0A9D4L385_DREPO|nr:hypothetical protein DPMN_093039 [Dreissena polymorpha]